MEAEQIGGRETGWKTMESTAAKQNKVENSGGSLNLLGNIKCTNIHIVVAPDENREKRPEKISEAMIAENVPDKGKETVIQVQKAQRTPGRIYPRKNLQKHRVVKLTKIKENEKALKATRETQQIIYTRELT